jgi:hypothetical protein
MKRLIQAAAILLMGAVQAHAVASGASFLKINHSARSYALGDSGVVNAVGAEAIGANPGNLTEIGRKMEILSAYTSMTEGVSYAHIGGAINRSRKKNLMVDAIGFSYTRLSVSGLDGRDKTGAKTADFGSQDSQMSFSLGGKIGKKLSLGATGKMVQSKIGEYKANTVFAADFGASYSFKRLGKGMKAGVAINNLGQGMKYLNQKDPLPTALNLGLSANLGTMNLTGGVNQNIKTNHTQMAFGMEMNLGMVSLRVGMNATGVKGNKTSGTPGIFEGLSTGIGLNLGRTRMDYAVGQNSADLGISHRMSLTLQFGKKR